MVVSTIDWDLLRYRSEGYFDDAVLIKAEDIIINELKETYPPVRIGFFCDYKDPKDTSQRTGMVISFDDDHVVVTKDGMPYAIHRLQVLPKEEIKEVKRKEWSFNFDCRCPKCGSKMIENKKHIECGKFNCDYIKKYKNERSS